MEYIDGVGYEIKENVIQRNRTYVAYPSLVAETKSEKIDAWNNIILQDIGRILNIYSAYIFSSPKEVGNLYLPDTLHITYDIKRNDNKYLSILYTANFYSPYAAYPTQMIYSTNIDKVSDKRIKLSDIILVDKSLVDDITSWDMVTQNNDNIDYHKAVIDYLNGLGKEVLYMGFKSADILGPDNYLDIYSYLTSDKLGVSISMPHYLGDHVEFERP